jgi:hypothetical protein
MPEDGESPGAVTWRDGATALASSFALAGTRGAGDRGASPPPARSPGRENPSWEAWSGQGRFRPSPRGVERPLGRARRFMIRKTVLGARQTRWTPLLLPSPTFEGQWTTDPWTPLEGRNVNGGVHILPVIMHICGQDA